MSGKEKKMNRKEFRDFCGVNGYPLNDSTLRSHIKRGHVIEDGDKMIDLFNPVNAAYIQKHSKAQEERNDILMNKQALEVERAEEELKIARLKRQKLEGEVIPTMLVKRIFAIHFKSMTQAFHQGADQIATDYVKKLKGTQSDLAEIKGRIIAVINNQADKAQKMSKHEIDLLVDEYSQTRGKGERR